MAGAALEGLVDDPEDAVALFESGSGVSLEPCHHRSHRRTDGRASSRRACGCSCSRTRATGRRTYCSLNEGLGKVLRYGAYGPEVLTRLRWMRDVLGPLLQRRRARRPSRSTSPGSSPRCCRWATRPTTATGPAP